MTILRSDEIEIAVLNALYWDLAVPRLSVKVKVENRWVTISGTVERPYQRTCAEADARGIPDVAGVTTQIRLATAPADQAASDPAHTVRFGGPGHAVRARS